MPSYPIAASVALALAVALSGATAATAQTANEMTAEEITKAFQQQKTRGLVLVPSGGDTAPTTSNTETTVSAPVAAEGSSSGYSAVEDAVFVNIRFDFDSAALREDQKPQLATLCQVMKSIDVQLFQIIGHTDSSGSASYNEKLSLLRAQEVKRHLVNDCGIAETRLEAIGMGEAVPYNAADPRSDENRRVEFQALG